MNRLNVRHHHAVGEIDLVQIADNLLGHLLRNVIENRRVGMDRSVRIVADLVKRRHIHPGDRPRRFMQKFRTGIGPRILHPDVKLHNGREHILALTDVEQVEKVRHRLGVEGARTAADDDGVILRAVTGSERNARKVEHIQHIRVAHFVLERKGNEIKDIQRVAALERNQRQVMQLHLLLHIDPRVINPLAPDVGMLVQGAVQKPHAEVGHPDLVGIGKAERKPRLHAGFVLDDLPVFAARISARLRNRFEDRTVRSVDRFVCCFHSSPSKNTARQGCLPRGVSFNRFAFRFRREA